MKGPLIIQFISFIRSEDNLEKRAYLARKLIIDLHKHVMPDLIRHPVLCGFPPTRE